MEFFTKKITKKSPQKEASGVEDKLRVRSLQEGNDNC